MSLMRDSEEGKRKRVGEMEREREREEKGGMKGEEREG